MCHVLDGELVRGIQNDRHSNPVDIEAARATGFSRVVSLQEIAAPNPTQSPPDPQLPSNLPLDYFTDGAPDETFPFTLHHMWDIADSMMLSNYEVDDMEWTNIFGELSAAGSTGSY